MTLHRFALLGAAAGGGLLAAAILQAAAAVATPDVDPAPSPTGADAFTIGNFTFDPYTLGSSGTGPPMEGFDPVGSLNMSAPLLNIGGGTPLGLPVAPQYFEVFAGHGSGATDLGNILTAENVTNLLGMTNTEFTVNTPTPIGTAVLPPTGAVYDVFNFGHGWANVYTATPDAPFPVTDTFVTPFGDVNLNSLVAGINAAAPLQPGDAFTGLAATNIGTDAFSIGNAAFDPFTLTISGAQIEGFSPVTSTAMAPPLLNLGGGSALGIPLAQQSFNVFDGTAKGAAEIGSINTHESVTNLLGLTNTEFTVDTVTPAAGLTAAQTAVLPVTGEVYDAFNFGNGWENVYTAVPGANGAVTDTFVTPFGKISLDSLFAGINAANPLAPGDAFTGLADTAIGKDAFHIGTIAFDPFTGSGSTETEGFAPVTSLLGAAPALNIGGGNALGQFLAPQSFNVFDGTGTGATDIGSIATSENVTNLLGLTNTEFTVTGITPAVGISAADQALLPVQGEVYDVFNLGNGWENIYTATPDVGSTPGTVADTFMTPFGPIDLSSLFGGINDANPLDPGLAFQHGLDVASAAATATDPLAFLGL